MLWLEITFYIFRFVAANASPSIATQFNVLKHFVNDDYTELRNSAEIDL